MPRDAGLVDARLFDNLVYLTLAVAKRFDNAAPRWVRESLEGV
jgi:hypothetical protein